MSSGAHNGNMYPPTDAADDSAYLICSIPVQIDGSRTEFLNVLEGDDPDRLVR